MESLTPFDGVLYNSDLPVSYKVLSEITLTESEKSIFEFLLEVIKDHNRTTVLRVAGGWVRDKLMGKESDDIDIALDDMYGEEFAEMIRTKIYDQDVKSGKIDPSKEKMAKNYGVIKSNSEKSKHLETAVIKVQGVFIDLVNLRSEEYAADSRVPVIEIGTPEQDAMRRDLTFNSMFYNINTGLIEDLTGKGVIDLEQRICRTPLEPL
jgi:tRNA nucleotidyltransferase (CCA-adding enzyme)